MHVIHTVAELRQHLSGFAAPAFVPTMGNLHDGHLALVRQAKPLGDVTVASIFVNRLQFLPHEDFDAYPRTLQADCDQLAAVGCDVVFAPTEHELYPEPQGFKVHPPPGLADVLEGHFRPGFFTGVSTVVMKLFHIVFGQARETGHAVFGKKDYQQLMVIRQMVRQMALPVQIHGSAIARAPDGLALSSRNSYLSADERVEAIQLHVALRSLAAAALAAPHQLAVLEQHAMHSLVERGWRVDYLTVRQRDDLAVPTPHAVTAGQLVALGAATLGRTRLIDNWEC